jgi:tetratricopeptide (TPR) repeat protein
MQKINTLTTIKKQWFFVGLGLVLSFFLLYPQTSWGAEKKIKKPTSLKIVTINDSTVDSLLKKTEEQMEKGDLDGSLRNFLKIYDYTKEVLQTVHFIKKEYEKLINDPAISQNEKEDLFIKLKRIDQLIPRYNSIKEKSAYHIGFIYTKQGDTEKAKKYLTEVIESSPFSTKPESLWMKAKTLLLSIYNLEGEF